VGYPLNEIDVRIIGISDNPIKKWSESLIVPNGEIGEIAVKGDIVTRQYFGRPEADALAKIQNGNEVWHRMGDLGWMDEKGRIWFCGRKSHRVLTKEGVLFTIPCEAIFNSHPAVFRSALVGVGNGTKQEAAICIELKKDNNRKNREKLKKELLDLANNNELTKGIKIILFHNAFPVDIRHNSKIFREKLAAWAEQQLRSANRGKKCTRQDRPP
jgi:acyl-CoA synthetase (AMP-forming)/AMP-acid ligase II